MIYKQNYELIWILMTELSFFFYISAIMTFIYTKADLGVFSFFK